MRATTLVVEVPGNINQSESSQGSTFQHQDPTPPNNLQAPELEILRANNHQERNTAPPIRRKAAQSHTKLTATSRHTLTQRCPGEGQDPAPLTRGKASVPPTRKFTQAPGPTSPARGAETRSKRNYNPAACGKETTNTESWTK